MRGRRRISRRVRWTAAAVLALAAAVGFFAARPGGSEATFALAMVSNQVLVDTADGKEASFVILLDEQADVSRAYDIADQDARGWYVYETLRDTAARTQGPLRAALEADSVPFRSFWAANMIVATGDRSLV